MLNEKERFRMEPYELKDELKWQIYAKYTHPPAQIFLGVEDYHFKFKKYIYTLENNLKPLEKSLKLS